jgi:hypothetical protein
MTPIGILLVIAFLTASSWLLLSLVRHLRRRRVGVQWWAAFVLLIVVGLAVGIWCAFHFEYQVGAHHRFGSFPIPVVFFHLEDGQWIDFPVPPLQGWASAVTNIVTVTALATLPLWGLSWWQHRHKNRPA